NVLLIIVIFDIYNIINNTMCNKYRVYVIIWFIIINCIFICGNDNINNTIHIK
ncbi:hypothetical protein NEIRO03_2708, partial [Nematocida sp. AWRm78]